MRKRSTEIIQAILRNGDKGLSIKELTKKYKISQKTLRNDIKEINQFLRDISASELIFTEKGEIARGPDFDEDLVERSLYEMDPYTYKLSTEERKIYIMMILTTSEQYITMQSFAEELFVSRITIVNDIEAVREEYRSIEADLVVDPGKGMLLNCGKKKRIEILTELYKEIEINVKNDGFFQRMILNRMHTQFEFSGIFDCMQEYMQMCSIIFVEDVFYELVLYVFVVFNFFRTVDTQVKNEISCSEIENMMLYTGHVMNVNVTQDMLMDLQQYKQWMKLNFIKSLCILCKSWRYRHIMNYLMIQN